MSGSDEREGFFTARDNLRLFWRSKAPPEPIAVAGIVHGYGEHSGRYLPLLDHLAAHGIAAHAFDYRGHGQADGRRGHCDAFGEFVDDLERFVQRVIEAAQGRPTYLLGHSMGGLILARWLLPDAPGADAAERGVRGLIFASPWLELAFKPPALKVIAARWVGRIVPWLPVSTGITSDQLTRDPAMRAAVERDPLFNWTATPRWFAESGKAQAEVRAGAAAIRLPSLVLVPEADPIASPAASLRFYESLGARDREVRRYPGARHELFNELPEVRERAMQDVVEWIRARSGR